MRIPRGFVTSTLVLVVVVALFELFGLLRSVAQQVDELSDASTGDGVWALSRLEIDFYRFEAALEAAQSPETYPELRTRFDLFYSRVATLSEGQLNQNIRDHESFAKNMATLDGFVEMALPYIDGNDAMLTQELAMLRSETERIASVVRRLSITGVASSSQNSRDLRFATRALLVKLATSALILICGLLVFAVVLRRLYLQSEQASRSSNISRARNEAMIESALDGILVTAPDGKILELNTAAEQVFGLDSGNDTGLHLSELLKGISETTRYGSPKESGLLDRGRLLTTGIRQDGSEFAAEVTLSQARTSQEDDVFVAYVRDISSILEAQKELRDARDKALQGEQAKDKLLAVMNHEIRTPLNGILGSLDLLKKTDLTDAQNKYLGAIETSGDVLMQHVNDVLELSRLDSDISKPPLEPLELCKTIGDLVDSQKAAAKAKGNTLSLKLSDDLPKNVLGNPQALRQVLLNLLGNALKFNNNGLINVDVEPFGRDDLVEFRVIDDGPGIAEENLGRLFEDFYTVDPTFSRTAQGTGLGLGITKRMVAAMGGEIGVESIEGEGSMFWFRVPLAPAPKAETTEEVISATPPDARGAKVLLVEDNEINQMITGDMLRNSGHAVDIAPNGTTAIRMAERNDYDLILMDISMPGMDGITAAKEIRRALGDPTQPPIFALTAQSIAPEDTKLSAAGITAVLPKPLTSELLQNAVNRALKVTACDIHDHSAGECNLMNPAVFADLLTNIGPERIQHHFDALSTDLAAFFEHPAPGPEANLEFRSQAHTLSGAAAVLGLCSLRRSLAKLEDHPDAQNLFDQTQQIWSESRETYQRALDRAANTPP
ncbi:MAG: ATP-binding protein [Pseudomonadota bacterium]|nr:ATP-binding protein [Pseudomonadota bacterium]